MGLRDGVSHTELRLTSRGPRVIESHDRVSGGRVMDLVEAVYGIDLERHAVGWPFRLVPELPWRPAARGAAATRFLTAEPGTVVAIEGADEVRAHPESSTWRSTSRPATWCPRSPTTSTGPARCSSPPPTPPPRSASPNRLARRCAS